MMVILSIDIFLDISIVVALDKTQTFHADTMQVIVYMYACVYVFFFVSMRKE